MRALTNELVTVIICSLPVVVLIIAAIFRRIKYARLIKSEQRNSISGLEKTVEKKSKIDNGEKQEGSRWKAAFEVTQ